MKKAPKISIGLPVYNGENFLSNTLDSILNQTFKDFEIIISDNASTDNTEKICRNYAEKDERIRYYRNKGNLGAAYNFNNTLKLSRGRYFKWASHDDLLAPRFLEKCVEALDKGLNRILCYTKTTAIDENGKELTGLYTRELNVNFSSGKPYKKLLKCIVYSPAPVLFGLIRSDILKNTRLIGRYASSDRVLLAELIMLGQFYEVQEYLFYFRIHPKQSWQAYPTRKLRVAWYDPKLEGKIAFPLWRLFRELITSIFRSSLKKHVKIMYCIVCSVLYPSLIVLTHAPLLLKRRLLHLLH